jgi:hypothetical protein
MHTNVQSENLKGRDLGKDGTIILKYINMGLKEIGCEIMDWIYLVQETV